MCWFWTQFIVSGCNIIILITGFQCSWERTWDSSSSDWWGHGKIWGPRQVDHDLLSDTVLWSLQTWAPAFQWVAWVFFFSHKVVIVEHMWICCIYDYCGIVLARLLKKKNSMPLICSKLYIELFHAAVLIRTYSKPCSGGVWAKLYSGPFHTVF